MTSLPPGTAADGGRDELEPADEAARLCPRCGAPYEEGQEYCLECGLRLPAGALAQQAAASELYEPPEAPLPPGWLWVAIAFLVIAALGGAAAVAFSTEGDADGSTIAATDPLPTAPTTRPATTATTGTVRTTTAATAPTRTTPPPPPPPARLIAWPRGRDGYTVVLESLPVDGGIVAARTRAREALRAGLPEVGVLQSSRYSSLHPGYYVVFSGVYDTLVDAQAAVADAASKGFRRAYPREVAS